MIAAGLADTSKAWLVSGTDLSQLLRRKMDHAIVQNSFGLVTKSSGRRVGPGMESLAHESAP